MRAELSTAVRAGVITGVALSVVELALVLLRARGAPLPIAPLAASLLGSMIVLGTLSASLGWCALRLLSAPRSKRTRVMRLALGAALGGVVGVALFSGTGVRRLGLQLPLTALSVALSTLALHRLHIAARPRGGVARAAGVAVALVIYALNAVVLVRQYALLHAVAGVVATTTLALSLRAGARAARGWALVPFAALTALLASSGSQGVRSALRAHAPLGRLALRVTVARAARPRLLAAPAPTRVASPRGPRLAIAEGDIVIVTVDALRADSLRANGGRGRMPNLDQLAASGINFRNAYCSTPHTSYSLASLMLGAHARAGLALHGAAGRETLAQRFGAQGYQTAAFYPSAVFAVDRARFGALATSRFGFDFAETRDDDAPTRVRAALRWLGQRGANERALLWVHLFEPHESYEQHAGFDFGGDPRSRYESECAFVDHAIGELRRGVAAMGRRATWIVTADHGEEFGEHGGTFHGTTVYAEQVRVPLVMWVPGTPAVTVDTPVSLVDIAPTLLAGIGLPRPARVTGEDLSPIIRGARIDRAVFAETGSLRRVTRGREALIADLSDESVELFDLDRDPLERANLADLRPARAAALREEISRWEDENARADTPARDAGPSLPAEIYRALQGERSVAPSLVRVASDTRRSEEVRMRALDALGDLRMRDEGVVEGIAPLRETSGALGRRAALTLALLGDPRGRDGAAQVFEQGSAADRRRSALALARVGDPRGVEALIAAMADPNASDRDRDDVIEVLAPLRDPRTFTLWESLLRDPRLGPAAARALGALGDRRGVAAIRAAYPETRYPITRRAMLGALHALGDPAVRDLVREALGASQPLPDVFTLLRAMHEPGREIVGRRRESGIAAGRSRALKLQLDADSWAPLRRVYVRLHAEGAGEVEVAGVTLQVPEGISEHAVELPGPLFGHRVRVTPRVDLRVLGIAAR